ncbi:S8 family serine peptidase, partial [Maribellus sp. YY47]|uniref:S8 family serine peptidase n=1 Tax=Maribellus sp. YY47 TaxID=2929486 RepID=UPI002000ED5A
MIKHFLTGLHIKGCFFILLIIFISCYSNAQPSKIRAESNQLKLNQFSQQRSARWNAQKKVADSVAHQLDIPIFYVEENDRVIVLQRLENNNKPVYYATNNLSVANTLTVDQVWSDANEFPPLSGDEIEINLWDGGRILSTHQEFQSQEGSRITMRDLDLPVSNHSTHISGTMIASGVKYEARGMAGKAIIKGWDLNNDIAEMASAAADGISISNHSYGPLCGWYYNTQIESWYWYGDPEISATEDYKFGFYSDVSADIDYIAGNAPYYLIVKSAGNDRNDGPATIVSHYVWDDKWVLVNAERDQDGGTDGFDCLSPLAVAKNILTIGAVDDAANMTIFSAFGPTDDGRIKPDLVSDGSNVYSSISSTDTSYTTYSGTSMSAAAATGAIALLLQLQNMLQPGVKLLSSTYKSILMHTAIDLGNTGPDFSFGWGLINIKAAADLIYANSNSQGENIYEQVLHEGETVTIPVKTANDAPFLKATLCWTDPAGQPASPALNQRTSKLVNDLNLQVENPNTGQTILPWVLNVENPGEPATSGTNHVDNVEQVYFANTGSTDFNIKVSHSGTLSGGSQSFSLVITGIETQSELYPPRSLTYSIGESSISLHWDSPFSGAPEKYNIYRNGSFLATSNTTDYTDASVSFDNKYSYYVTAVYTVNEQETESLGTNEIVVFPRTVRPLPYIIDFETSPDEALIKNDISGWQWGDSESLNCYYLDFSDNLSKFIAADSYSAGEAVHVSDIASTDPLLLANYSNVTLSFDYLLKTGIYDAIDELHVVYKLQEETAWHELMDLESAYEWVHQSIELPVEICKNGTQLGFYYDDLYQWGMGAGLDNIYVSGEEEIRNVDLTITALNAPVSGCSLSDNESISISIKNVGSQAALAGDSIRIHLNCSSNESLDELLVLSTSLSTGEVLDYEFNAHLDLSNEQLYTFEFQMTCTHDNNTANNLFEKTIEVFGYPQPTIITPQLSFCEDSDPVLIEAVPEGGVLSGTGVSGAYFYPAVAGTGIHLLSYTLTDENDCTGETTVSIVVNSIPQPEFLNTELSFCEDSDPVLIEAIPEGGVLSGTGVSGTYFYPAVAGTGLHLLTYTVTDVNGCTGETTVSIVVNSIPQPEILNTELSFCEDSDPVLIEAVPEGGVLSGTGVSELYFDPSVAGTGIHTLTYSVTDENGCTAETTVSIVVNSIPQPEILNTELSFCEDSDPVLIEAVPEGGVLSGTGVSGLYFDPSVAGTGIHTLTYSVTDENGCIGETTVSIVVNSIPQPEILNTELSFCEDSDPVLIEAVPEGGVLSGTGVSGAYFYPAVAGTGTHLLTYTVTDTNGCTGETTVSIVVNSIPQPEILNTELSFCEDSDPVLIEAIPEGGILSGTGVSGTYFYPAVAGTGIHTLTYSVTDENGCTGETTANVVVNSIPQPEILNTELSFCEDSDPVLIEAIPEGGILSGTGVSGTYFYPAVAGTGIHTLT